MTWKLAGERAVHITGKLRKEPDTAVFVSAHGLIRTRDFYKSGSIVTLLTRIPLRDRDRLPYPVRNDALGGPNPFEWKDVSTAELFAGRNVVLFGVPGAFTPACSETHLPGYEPHYDDFRADVGDVCAKHVAEDGEA
jgi:hypothetical protein